MAVVYEAVVAGKSAAELRAIIEECAVGSGTRQARGVAVEQRRLAALNAAVAPPPPARKKELPLAAARRLRRLELICVLVEKGAKVEPVFGRGATPLAVCIACGEENGAEASVRALLQQGADASAPVGIAWPHDPRWCFKPGERTCTAAHLCVGPCRVFDALGGGGPARLRCLDALLREGGGAPDLVINAVDSCDLTPLAWLGDRFEADDAETWLAPLLELGADPNRCGHGPFAAPPALHWILVACQSARPRLVACLRTLAAAGARLSGGVFDMNGDTPLIAAAQRPWFGEVVRFLLEEGHADVHEPNRVTGALPLTCCYPDTETVAALLAAGADPSGADRLGRLLIVQAFSVMGHGYDKPRPGAPLALLRAGASLDGVRGPRGEPPFLRACAIWGPTYLSDDRVALLEELLRRAPEAERRARLEDGRSAVDLVAGNDGWLSPEGDVGDWDLTIIDLPPIPGADEDDDEQWLAQENAALQRSIAGNRRMVAELVISGASVSEESEEEVNGVIASCALPMVARRVERSKRELAARCSEARRWRAHDCMVELALEERDVREADARLAARRARLAALERAVAEAE